VSRAAMGHVRGSLAHYGRILGGEGPERENQKSKNQKSIIY
jgi:hypothetical protein